MYWIDIGSGGGFSGLVIVVVVLDWSGEFKVIFIESDICKCLFLRSVLCEMGVFG